MALPVVDGKDFYQELYRTPVGALQSGVTLLVIAVTSDLVPVVQWLDNAIHRKNRYPVDKC